MPVIYNIFLTGVFKISSMDLFHTEDFYEETFEFTESTAVNQKFETFDFDNKIFLLNSGPLFMIFIIIVIS